jgi:hypothetical protein
MATPRRIRNQARDLAFVRYSPELSALTALLKQAQQTRSETIQSGRSAATAIQATVDRARPEVRNVYTAAQRTANAANKIAAPSLAALPAGNPFSAAAAIEQSGLQGRLGESQAATLSELSERRVDAAAGAAGQARQANTAFGKTAQQLGTRRQDIGREAGSFITSTIRDLMDANASAKADAQRIAAGLVNSRGNAWISAGVDPATGKPIPGGRLDPAAPQNQPAGKKWATSAQQTAAAAAIQSGFHAAAPLSTRGVSREDAAAALRTGAKPRPVYETVQTKDRTGRVTGTKQQKVLNPDGTPKMTSSVPKVKEELYIQAAIEMAYDGHLSKRTQRLLHKNRIQIAPLGVTSAGEYERRRRARIRKFHPRVVNAPSGIPGQTRPT